MTKLIALALGFAIFGLAPVASADVQVSMQSGHVTVVAKDATVRQILAEWARVGQTKIVNGERVGGGPLTLELRDLPEQQALNILLRSVSGFLVAPRAAAAGNLSVFDRIVVLPTAVAPAAPATASAAPPAFSQPTFVQPLPAVRDDDDDPPEPATNPGQPGAPGNRGPVFVFPQPQVTNPQQRPTQMPPQQFPQIVQPTLPQVGAQPPVTVPGAPTTSGPTGVSVPGMVVPAPPQPGQPGQPQREQ